MEIFQLRLRDGQTLDAVVFQVCKAVLATPVFDKDNGRSLRDRFRDLQERIRTVLSGHIRGSDLCGGQVLCDESLEPSDWTPLDTMSALQQDAVWAPHIQRLRLELGSGLDELLNEFDRAVFEFIGTSWAADDQRRKELETAIKSAVGPYLYRNLACGNCDLCTQGWPLKVH